MDINHLRIEALKHLIGSRKTKDFADQYDLDASYLSQMINGHRPMGEKAAKTLEIKIGLPHGSLVMPLTAASEQTIQPQSHTESNAELLGMMSAWDGSTTLHDDEVAIPLYKEVELAAGSGATEVAEVPGRLLRFAKSTLREAGVQECNAACVTIRGRSMERLIMDGATAGVDRGTTHIEDGEIYAFDQEGMLRVKYLYRLPGGSVRIRSENDEEFPDEILTAEQFAHVRMLGWVFWWSTLRRRRGLKLAK